MLRNISAVVLILWAAILGGGAVIAMAVQLTPGVQGQRAFVALTYAVIPLVAAIIAIVRHTSLPLIVSWALLAGSVLQKLQFDMSQRGFTVANGVFLTVSVAGLVISVLSRREDSLS